MMGRDSFTLPSQKRTFPLSHQLARVPLRQPVRLSPQALITGALVSVGSLCWMSGHPEPCTSGSEQQACYTQCLSREKASHVEPGGAEVGAEVRLSELIRAGASGGRQAHELSRTEASGGRQAACSPFVASYPSASLGSFLSSLFKIILKGAFSLAPAPSPSVPGFSLLSAPHAAVGFRPFSLLPSASPSLSQLPVS